MNKTWKLTTKLGVIGGALLVLALVSVGLTLSVTWQLEGGAAAVNEAGRMRMQTWRLAQTLTAGDMQAFQGYRREFDFSLELLATGDPSRPLFMPNDEATLQAFLEVRQGWEQLREDWSGPIGVDPTRIAPQADAYVQHIDKLVTAIETRLQRWTAVLHTFELALMLLAIGSAIGLLYAAYLFVFDPLSKLQQGLQSIRDGNFATRVDLSSGDEFGALAAGFNRMAETLQGLYGNLESKVRDKTQRLVAERERLSALYEASAGIGRAETVDDMAKDFAKLIRKVARADASAVRWADENNQRYVMLASDRLPESILQAEQCLPTASCYCGQKRDQASTRMIPIKVVRRGEADTGRPVENLGHCSAVGFQSVMSIPLKLQDRLVGEVDLFFREAPQIARDDRVLLDTLASHLAGGMESMRALALQREAAIAHERGFLARELHDSIAQSLAFLKIQLQLLRDAIKRQDASRIDTSLGELDTGLRECTADVRELLVHFRTRTNQEDILPALQSTLQKFEHQSGLQTRLIVLGDDEHQAGLPLPPDEQIQVLHVVQEALSNVRKHAHARDVRVVLDPGPPWQVQVIDDGQGFAQAPGPDEDHVGLRIMRERAHKIGAEVRVESTPGIGTRVCLTLKSGPQAHPAFPPVVSSPLFAAQAATPSSASASP